MPQRDLKTTVIALWLGALLIFKASPYVFGLLTSQDGFNTSGVVADVTIGVYRDASCTTNLTAINWGLCYPGDDVSQVVYVRNVGTVNITLTVQTENWAPTAASAHLTLSHDYTGDVIAPEAVVPVTLHLSVAPDVEAIESFGFDILLTSQG
jgi:hypothetical protein